MTHRVSSIELRIHDAAPGSLKIGGAASIHVRMQAVSFLPDVPLPDSAMQRAVERLRTPLWFVNDELRDGPQLLSANAAARALHLSVDMFPSAGDSRTMEVGGRLMILCAHPAPDIGIHARMIEATPAPRHRSEVCDGVKAVFNHAPEGAAIVGRDGCIHWTNRAYDEVTGRIGAKDVGASLQLAFTADPEAALEMREALVFGTPADIVAQCGDDPVSLRFLPLEDDLGRAPNHLVLIHDEASADAAAALSVRLTNNEVHLKALEDLVPGVLFQLERSARGRHRFGHVGARCESVLGITAVELEDRVDRLFDVINGEDLRELKNALEASRQDLSPLSWTGRTTPEEGPPRWIQITARAVAQPDDGVRWHGMISDISHQKEMQRRVESHERLASVGELAAGVAHEINNPLAYVIANIRTVLEDIDAISTTDTDSMAAVISALREAEGGAERVHQIVRDLKQLSRPTAGNVAPVDVKEVIKTSASMAMSQIRHVAALNIDVVLDRRALGNEARLTQVMLNLLVNAAQAIPAGDAQNNDITVRARSDDENVTIEVVDSGVGIAPDVVERIYEPFFTTKTDRGGTGLGLAMVHNIVREHGGRLEVESTVGEGSCFRIVLAVAPVEMLPPPPRLIGRPTVSMRRAEISTGEEAAASNITAACSAPDAPIEESKRVARVLVVDDEPSLARALARQLRTHDVIVAGGGTAAKEILMNSPAFDVILCDLMMPDLNGMELYREVLAFSPDLCSRFVFMTGGVFTDDARTFLADTDVTVLEKPFEAGAVRSVVNRIVDSEIVIQDATPMGTPAV